MFFLLLSLLVSLTSAGSTRCGGPTWTDANNQCGNDCIDDAQCTFPETCFANLHMTACSGGVIDVFSTTRCGIDSDHAHETCGVSCTSGTDGECPAGQFCFGLLPPCDQTTTSTTSSPAPAAPYAPPSSGNCQPQDFIFFLDASSSVIDEDFNGLIAMVESLTLTFPPSARVAAMAFTFDDLVALEQFWITDFASPSDAAGTIGAWTRPSSGGTFLATGLEYLLDYSPIQWDQDLHRKRELVIFCDGMVSEPDRFPDLRLQLDAVGVSTTVVGITDAFMNSAQSLDALKLLLEDPDEDLVWAQDFGDLQEVQMSLESLACTPTVGAGNVEVNVNVEGDEHDIDVEAPVVNVQNDVHMESPVVNVEPVQPMIHVAPAKADVVIQQSLLSVPSTETFILYMLIFLILFVCCFLWILAACFCIRDQLFCICCKRVHQKDGVYVDYETDYEIDVEAGVRTPKGPKRYGSFLGHLEQVVSMKTSDEKEIKVKCKGFQVNNVMDNSIRAALMRCAALHAEAQHNFDFERLEVTKLEGKNEYQFGNWHRKTYVRETNGRLMARVGGGWEELHKFIGRIVKRSASVGKFNEASKLANKGEKFANGDLKDVPAPKQMGAFAKVVTHGNYAPEGILKQMRKTGKYTSESTMLSISEGRRTRCPGTPVE